MSLLMMSHATTSSSASSRIPMTPVAVRPIERTLSSENRIALPLRVIRRMSLVPDVGRTFTTSSPSRRLSAMIPSRRDESYSRNRVFFTMPFLVTISRYRFVS